MIPSQTWLRHKGYRSLADRICRKPNLFSHLHREKVFPDRDYATCMTDKDAVALAERLASANRGQIPEASWLLKNGHQHLYRRIRRKPALFAHLKRLRLVASDDEAVSLATKLAAENGGSLPGQRWLRRNGYSGLYRRISMKPRLFAHLVRA